MKTLMESLQKLVDMERTAFGMDKEIDKKDDPLDALLNKINNIGSAVTPVLRDPARGGNDAV